MIREAELPASPEAERTILGAILLNESLWPQAALLKPEDFSLNANRRIYGRMCDLQKSGRPVEMILLAEELERHRETGAIGGRAYLSSLIDGVPERPSIEHYVSILKNKTALREAAKFAESLSLHVGKSDASPETVREQIATFQEKLDSGLQQTSNRIRSWEQIPTLDSLPVGDVDWVVEGMIPAGSVVLWAGESGSYKTWLSLWLAKAVSEGGDFLGRKTVQREVLYLDRENPLQLIRDRCSLLGIQSSNKAFRVWGGWESEQPPMIGDRRLLEFARTIKPIIVVDSFIRFHAADENSATEMGRVMGEVRALANAGAVVSLQHHKPKAEGALFRGSSDIKAGVDVAFAISCDKGEKSVTLQCFKNRFGEETAITVKPKLDEGAGFEVTSDPLILRQREAELVVLRVIQGRPGISQTDVVKWANLPLHKVRSILEKGDGTQWRTERGPRNRLEYYPLAADLSFSTFQPYSTEKLKSSNEEFSVIEGEV